MQHDLARLISQRMHELGLSYRAAAARSEHRVSHATLNALVTGRHSYRIDDDTAEGIARALDVPLADVRRAAGLSERQPRSFALPERAAQLSPRGRRALVAMLDALLEAESAAAERERRADVGDNRASNA